MMPMDLIPIVRRALLLIGLRHTPIHSIWTHLLVVEFAELGGEWHYGNVVRVGFINEISNWANSDTSDDYFVHCGAFTKDGTYVEARIQQKFTQKNDQWDIFDNPSQYLVQVPADDGSMWGDWGDWSECSKTCGQDAVRSRTRSCLDGKGNSVAPHTAVNCLPEKGSHDANNWNFSGLQACFDGIQC